MTSLIAPPGGGDDLKDVEEEVDNIQVEVESSEDVLLRRQGVLKKVKILSFLRELVTHKNGSQLVAYKLQCALNSQLQSPRKGRRRSSESKLG